MLQLMKAIRNHAISSWVLMALIVIMLLGFTLLLTGILDEVLWADEGWTIAATAEDKPMDVITEWVAVDVHPPLFFVGLRIWRQLTGDSLLELRYYSVLLSMLAIAVVFRMGRVLFGQRAGVLAALFYALHDLVNVLTQEVRHYPQQMLMGALTLWFYWRFWRKPRWGRGIVFVLAGTLLLYTHYWGGFVLLALALHALLTQRSQWRSFLMAFAGVGILFLPWLPALIHQIRLERPSGLPHALENTFWVYKVLAFQLFGRPEWLWIILMLVGAMGAYGAMKWRPSAATLAPMLIVVLTPVLSVLLNAQYPTLSFRALAVIVPAGVVLAAHGLAQFRDRELGVVVVFVVIFSLGTTSATPAVRAPWDEIADFLTSHTTESDVILLEFDTDVFSTAYYMAQLGRDAFYVHSQATREFHPGDYETLMQTTLTDAAGIWVGKLGWPGLEDEVDIRPELASSGFVMSAPAYADFGLHIDRPILLWRLDRQLTGEHLTTFGEELQLIHAEATSQPGQVVVNMVWSPLVTPTQEYTISVILFGPDQNLTHDSRPFDGRSLTSTWEPDRPYYDGHIISTEGLPLGTYRVGVQVYYFLDEAFTQIQNIPAADCDDDANCQYVIFDEVVVE